MNSTKKFFVSNDESKIRIDRWLRRKFDSLPQNYIQNKLRKGIITLNGKRVEARKIINFKDEITIKDFDNNIYLIKKNNEIKRILDKKYIKKFLSSVIIKNDDFLIINKWKGISTQGGTKINISIDDIIKSISSKMNLVHRLDKETSGALIISKNYKTSRYFSKLLKERKINKTYLAICEGLPKKNQGTINLSILKSKNKIKTMISQKSSTKYKLIKKNNDISLILFTPSTGRKHQIRIVSKSLGCPILGDRKYNKYSKYKNINSLMLHSFCLNFLYQSTSKTFFAPIPKVMQEKIQNFKINLQDIFKNIY